MAINVGIVYGPPIPVGGPIIGDPLVPGDVPLTDMNFDGVTKIRSFQHILDSVTSQDGIGASISFDNQNSSGSPHEAVLMSGIFVDETSGTENSVLQVDVYRAGALLSVPALYVEEDGVGIGTDVVNFTGQLGTSFLNLGPGPSGGSLRGTIEFRGDTELDDTEIGAIHAYNGADRVCSILFSRGAGASDDQGTFRFQTREGGGPAPVTHLEISETGNVVIGPGALATTADGGFLWIRSCSGVPTGVPFHRSGRAALVYNSSGNDLYAHDGSGGWNLV